jgi:NAD(P)-dependent dehydrogenase (short-subunit alcohol dehydrogenase family)
MPASGGSIVNITSIEAHRAAPGFAVYSAMKAALVNLSKTLALELGDRHIRVNCIAPDVIPTPGIGGDLPVKTPLQGRGDIQPGTIEGCRCIRAILHGPYRNVGKTYTAMLAWAKEKDLRIMDESIEFYLNDPRTTSQQDLETEVLVPVRE